MASVESRGVDKQGNERWRLIVEGPKKLDGTRNQIKRSFKGTEKQAKKAALKLEIEVNKPQYIEPSKETFSQHVARWLEVHGETIQPKTLYRYKELLDRIIPYIGALPVERIRIETIEDLYRSLAKEQRQDRKEGTLSAKTIQHHARVLHTVLEYAVKRQLIPSNPATYVKPPSAKSKDIQYFNEEQITKLMEVLEEESILNKTLVNLALSTGARAGELAALTWDDIDTEKKTVRINKSAQYLPGLGSNHKKEPKTESSKRTVTVSASVIFLLRMLKNEQESQKEELGTKWIDSNSVFCGWNGAPVHPEYPSHWWHKFIRKPRFEIVKESIYIKRFRKTITIEMCRKINLPLVSFHGLRHSCASLLLSKGQNPVAVAKRLGHANTNVTLKVYAHTYQKDDQVNADIMGKILDGKADKKETKAINK